MWIITKEDKDKEIKAIKDSYSDNDAKLKEYEKLKEIESSYNSLIASKRDDLIYKIVGDNQKEAEKFKDYSVEQLETTVELLQGSKNKKGITPNETHLDDGNDAPQDVDEDVYTDEMFEEDFKNSGL